MLPSVEPHHEIRGLYISMDIAGVMELLNGLEHLKEDRHSESSGPSLLETSAVQSEVLAHELHCDTVGLLWACVHKVAVHFAHPGEVWVNLLGTLDVEEHLVFELQNALRFI